MIYNETDTEAFLLSANQGLKDWLDIFEDMGNNRRHRFTLDGFSVIMDKVQDGSIKGSMFTKILEQNHKYRMEIDKFAEAFSVKVQSALRRQVKNKLNDIIKDKDIPAYEAELDKLRTSYYGEDMVNEVRTSLPGADVLAKAASAGKATTELTPEQEDQLDGFSDLSDGIAGMTMTIGKEGNLIPVSADTILDKAKQADGKVIARENDVIFLKGNEKSLRKLVLEAKGETSTIAAFYGKRKGEFVF